MMSCFIVSNSCIDNVVALISGNIGREKPLGDSNTLGALGHKLLSMNVASFRARYAHNDQALDSVEPMYKRDTKHDR